MTRHSVNVALNTLLFAALVSLALSGFVMDFAFEHGHGHGQGQGGQWLGVSRHGWQELHSICAYLFVGASLAHLYLHWAWIRQVLLGGPGASALRRSAGMAGLGLAVALLASALTLPFLLPGEAGANCASGGAAGEGGRHLGWDQGGRGHHGGWEQVDRD